MKKCLSVLFKALPVILVIGSVVYILSFKRKSLHDLIREFETFQPFM